MKNACILVVLLAACGEDDGHNENELITTVQLTFTPQGGVAVIAEFHDPDGDGGTAPTADPVNLANATTYTLTVKFLNRLVMPEEDITLEVNDESTDHQAGCARRVDQSASRSSRCATTNCASQPLSGRSCPDRRARGGGWSDTRDGRRSVTLAPLTGF